MMLLPKVDRVWTPTQLDSICAGCQHRFGEHMAQEPARCLFSIKGILGRKRCECPGFQPDGWSDLLREVKDG